MSKPTKYAHIGELASLKIRDGTLFVEFARVQVRHPRASHLFYFSNPVVPDTQNEGKVVHDLFGIRTVRLL